jgi:alpha-mannosidase
MQSAGIEWFITQKLSWSLINKFPFSSFHWRGIDGSQVLTHFPPADTYTSNGGLEQVMMSHTNFKNKGNSRVSLLLFGDGDGGGGPKLNQIESVSRMKSVTGIPKVKLSTVESFFTRLEEDRSQLPTWEGELYLELHNGTYTTQAANKKSNKYSERLLRDIEFFASLS